MDSAVQKQIAVEWKAGRPKGQIRVTDGRVVKVEIVSGRGNVSENQFADTDDAPFRLRLSVEGLNNRYSKNPTIVSVSTEDHAFSFLMRDVDERFPIFIPEYGVVVTSADDVRSFAQIEASIKERAGRTRLQQIDQEPEESFETAASEVRRMSCHTWLGLSRNMRIFAMGEKLEWIEPRLHYFQALIPENDRKPFRYEFVMGRGWGPTEKIERSIEENVLPILHGNLVDGDIAYKLTTFVTREAGNLKAETLQGTDFLLADGFAKQHMFTGAQQARFDSLLPVEMESGEETVLFLRISATNTASVPRYAFLRTIWPSKGLGEGNALEYRVEANTGFSVYESGRVFAISKLDGVPLVQEEAVVLLQPGESTVMDVFLPHRPIPRERAERLSRQTFEQQKDDCKTFWQSKLKKASTIELPEKRITEMIQAGLLHLDLITYGSEPEGALAATIGDYPPIGSESSPIIQFMDSMGWHDVARRSLEYFLEKQHDDGFMQNFNNYMLETGAVLWSIGEHYRYTRDDVWAKEIAPKVIRSCEFLQAWRQRNQREDLRGKGYGMLEGKTADPNDPYRSFMLNGYAYLGFSRIAEIFEKFNPAESAKWKAEAEGLKADIRDAFFTALESSPVVPLGDGRWCPTCPPWVESRGPLALHIDGSAWHTHGSMVARDSLLGPLYLVYQEILDPAEVSVSFLLDFHSELMTDRNVVFSQPYYSRHPWIHLMRGETKAFLKAYYNTMASLADRETYTFWEHYFRASAHKTHEEAWFLMETRWMLYLESGQTLHLLAGIPRDYMQHGKRIVLKNVASYFGPLSLTVSSRTGDGNIEAHVECSSERRPERVELRMPHPAGLKAKQVNGG
ncbi:MAG TPA: hypothetical protein VH079_19210, partial [Terriglobales bacterium]|nr:hypothetical protein [Terriglobales bacterium]